MTVTLRNGVLMSRQKNYDKVVEACRSGDYKFGTAMFRSADDCYCIMGVACELAIADGVVVEKSRRLDREPRSIYYGAHVYGDRDHGHSVMPTSVSKWLIGNDIYCPFENTMARNDSACTFEWGLIALAEELGVTYTPPAVEVG